MVGRRADLWQADWRERIYILVEAVLDLVGFVSDTGLTANHTNSNTRFPLLL